MRNSSDQIKSSIGSQFDHKLLDDETGFFVENSNVIISFIFGLILGAAIGLNGIILILILALGFNYKSSITKIVKNFVVKCSTGDTQHFKNIPINVDETEIIDIPKTKIPATSVSISSLMNIFLKWSMNEIKTNEYSDE